MKVNACLCGVYDILMSTGRYREKILDVLLTQFTDEQSVVSTPEQSLR
jgi:hypothetical protein